MCERVQTARKAAAGSSEPVEMGTRGKGLRKQVVAGIMDAVVTRLTIGGSGI